MGEKKYFQEAHLCTISKVPCVSQSPSVARVGWELLEAADRDSFILLHALYEDQADQELRADAETDLFLDTPRA